jgi:hypothetical protein
MLALQVVEVTIDLTLIPGNVIPGVENQYLRECHRR